MPQVRTVKPDGDRIRELRLDLGLTPAGLAERVGPNRHVQTIRKLERGLDASELLVAQVARALKVKLSDITQREQNGQAA